MTQKPVSETQAEQAIFWLVSPSPGRVLRALERLHQTLPTLPIDWQLSSPDPPTGLRVLCASVKGDTEATGAHLSRSLGVPVAGVQTGVGGGHWAKWEQGTQTGHGPLALAAPRRWWQKLPGVPALPVPWQVWAQSQNLPVLPPTRNLVPYRTVASLDKRALLVERARAWYALTLGTAI